MTFRRGARSFACDPKGRLWKVTRLGLAGSYFWSDSFSGWTLGIDWAVAF